jgi:hypothetical protein
MQKLAGRVYKCYLSSFYLLVSASHFTTYVSRAHFLWVGIVDFRGPVVPAAVAVIGAAVAVTFLSEICRAFAGI